jgi:hypothetical protein
MVKRRRFCKVEIRKSIRTAIKTFSAHPLLYLVMGAVVAYGSLFTLGILSGPLIGGFVNLGLVHQRTGRPPGFRDLASGFQNLGNLFLLSLLIVLCWVGVGVLLPPLLLFTWWAYIPLFILIVALSTWWMYAPVLIADRGMSLRKAMQASKARVSADGAFYSHLGFVVSVFILPPAAIFGLAAILPLGSLLNFLVCPIQFLALACAYEDAFGTEPPVMHFQESTGAK